MMTRAQNETCDVITAAAAAADAGLSHSQNGNISPSSSAVCHQQALPSPPTHGHGHRQVSVDARRVLADSAVRQSRLVSDRYSSSRAPAGMPTHLGGPLDDNTVGRRWLAGRIRNGPHGRVAAPLDRRSGAWSSLVADGGVHAAPLNLTCQAAERRSTTDTPHPTNVVDDSLQEDRQDCSQRRSWGDTTSDWSAINGVVVAQHRSMSARTEAEERPTKLRRRTCWSVDNISNEPRNRPAVAKPATYDDLVLHRRQQSYRTLAVAVNSCYQKNMAAAWHGAPTSSSTDLPNYCNNVVTTTLTSPLAGQSSSPGVQENAGLTEPDRLLVDAPWSRVNPPGQDGDLRPGVGGQDGAASECSVVAQEPGAADDDDDDALRQLLRLIQQPDGQPVFLCRHCDIIYADRMLYALHMGLHNVNNPWQCNICGTTCSGRQQFALHAIHY